MSFLSPWFLLGSLAVGVPIWLHLIRREQPTHIPFSSLMFFRRIPVKSTSRKRLRYLLLFATRVLIVLLLALAFARPFFPSLAGALSSRSQRKNMVILLDTSQSMRYGDRWQRAVAAARDAIGSLRDTDQGQIVSFGSEFEILNLATSDKAALRAVLDRIGEPSDSATSYSQAFRAAAKIAEDLQQPVSVVLITDSQKSGANDPGSFPSGPIADFKFVDVGSGDAPNWTVAQARSRRTIFRSKYPDRILVEVRGYGTSEQTKELALSLNGKVADRKKVTIPASGKITATFDDFDVPLGENQCEIELTPHDGLPKDDTFHFVLERRQPYRLLFVRDPSETAELYYMRSALAAESDSPYTIDARTPIEAASLNLDDYAAAIFSDVPNPPDRLVSALRNYVQRGHGIVVTMGSRFTGPEVEANWKDLLPAKIGAKKLMTQDRERMILFGQIDKDHPIFKDFDAPGAMQSLRSAETFGYVRLEPKGKAPVRYSNGDPFIVERDLGQGRVLLFASLFDNVWSDLPLHPAFVPLVHETVRFAAQIPEDSPSYSIPSVLSLGELRTASGSRTAAQQWEVTAPDGKRAVALDQSERRDSLPLKQAGFYRLRQLETLRLVASNTDPREGDLKQLSGDDRKLWAASASGQNAGTAPGPETAKRQSVWWALLFIALLLGGVETYLANQFLGRRVAIATDETKESAHAG